MALLHQPCKSTLLVSWHTALKMLLNVIIIISRITKRKHTQYTCNFCQAKPRKVNKLSRAIFNQISQSYIISILIFSYYIYSECLLEDLLTFKQFGSMYCSHKGIQKLTFLDIILLRTALVIPQAI